VVYIVWGSTYLAIRVCVREGAGFPPFTMAAMRVFAAAIILFSWSILARKRIKAEPRELAVLCVVGVLLWLGGNGGALLIGLAGIAVLNGKVILEGAPEDLYSALALVAAAVLWGMGTILQKRKAVSLKPEVSSAYQHLFGGVALLLTAMIVAEPRPTPIPQAWMAWGYLVVFGSLFAFTSFVKALRLLPVNIVMTYAYVNPVVAVILGRVILDEPITRWTIGGSVLIVLGVMGVFHERRAAAR